MDPKDNKTNKHRYVVASQDIDTRKAMRGILGVPLVYINRSVMIMEPMAEKSVEGREREERSKFRDGLKRGSGSLKRKREDGEDEDGAGAGKGDSEEVKKKKKTARGVKGPNPLAVKKAKKKVEGEGGVAAVTRKDGGEKDNNSPTKAGKADAVDGDEAEAGAKRKRKRKHKSGAAPGDAEPAVAVAEVGSD